jgi:hypothetical protein
LKSLQRQYAPMRPKPHPYLKKRDQPPEPVFRRAKMAASMRETVKPIRTGQLGRQPLLLYEGSEQQGFNGLQSSSAATLPQLGLGAPGGGGVAGQQSQARVGFRGSQVHGSQGHAGTWGGGVRLGQEADELSLGSLGSYDIPRPKTSN